MQDEDKQFLREVLEISRDNQKKINYLYRRAQWSRVWSIVYWVFIIGSAFGAYYLIQPYFDYLKGASSTLQDQVNTTKKVGDAVQNIFQ